MGCGETVLEEGWGLTRQSLFESARVCCSYPPHKDSSAHCDTCKKLIIIRFKSTVV